MSLSAAEQIAYSLRGDSERLQTLANSLSRTNLAPAMVPVGDAARLLARAAREIDALLAARARALT